MTPRRQALREGDRVKVRQDETHGPGPWPSEPMGTIVGYPDTSWRLYREVETISERKRLYWIVFDTPQLDAEGNGPYESAEVLEDYLQRVTSSG